MRRILPLVPVMVLLACLSAPRAEAGPWPRAPGEGFLSFSVNDRGVGDAYLEYGLPRRVVLSLAVERGPRARRTDLALRWHPPETAGGIVSGVTLGLRHLPDLDDGRRAMLGVAVGRGFETGAGNVWARAGMQLLAPPARMLRRPDLDLGAQLGLRRGGLIAMLGATGYRGSGGWQRRIRPALGYELNPRLTLVGEAALTTTGRRDAMRVTVWSRF